MKLPLTLVGIAALVAAARAGAVHVGMSLPQLNARRDVYNPPARHHGAESTRRTAEALQMRHRLQRRTEVPEPEPKPERVPAPARRFITPFPLTAAQRARAELWEEYGRLRSACICRSVKEVRFPNSNPRRTCSQAHRSHFSTVLPPPDWF
jgi:hypothetical protein